MTQPKITDAGEVLRHLIKPLCAALDAGLVGDPAAMLPHVKNVARVLDVCGYYREAQKVEECLPPERS